MTHIISSEQLTAELERPRVACRTAIFFSKAAMKLIAATFIVVFAVLPIAPTLAQPTEVPSDDAPYSAGGYKAWVERLQGNSQPTPWVESLDRNSVDVGEPVMTGRSVDRNPRQLLQYAD